MELRWHRRRCRRDPACRRHHPGLLDEGKGSLAALASVWGGSGSEAYQAVQTRWDSTSAELNAALQNLAQTISEAGNMAQTEAGVTGMFA